MEVLEDLSQFTDPTDFMQDLRDRLSSSVNKIYISETQAGLEKDRQNIIKLIANTQYDETQADENGLVSTKVFGILSGRRIMEVLAGQNSFVVSYNSDCRFEARLNTNNLLEMDAYLVVKTPEGRYARHPYMPHFSQLFALTLDYFHRVGKEVKGVYGGWFPAIDTDKHDETNYEVYWQSIHDGLSKEEAAFNTPTGRVVGRHGFDRVMFGPTVDPLDEMSQTGIDVLFVPDDSRIIKFEK